MWFIYLSLYKLVSSITPSYLGFIPTCCRWYHVSWLPQVLLLSSGGQGQRSRPWPFPIISSILLSLGDDHETGICIWTVRVMMVSKLCCFRYIWTCVVITLLKLRCMLNYVWTCCNMWQCMLNHVRSWLYVGDDLRSFMILDGLPGLYGLKYDDWPLRWLLLYLCSYKLDSSVTVGIGTRFNINLSYVYLKQRLFFRKPIFSNL
jgi:hypothetical protein